MHSLLKVNVSGLFLAKDLLQIDSRKRLPPVSDIKHFTFWVVVYGRWDLSFTA